MTIARELPVEEEAPVAALAVVAAERPDPDAGLVDAARAGDEQAVRQLYQRHAGEIARRMRLLVGEAAAHDLVQESFLTAVAQLDRFDGRSAFRAWLGGIALHKARNYRRKRARRLGLLDRFWRPPASPTDIAADAGVEANELMRTLEAALDQLSPVQREAFVLRHIEERSLAEVAELTGESISTISHRARRAARLVRAHFEERS